MRNNRELSVKVLERNINKYHDRRADSIPKIVFRTKRGVVDKISGDSSVQKWNANELWDLSTSSGLIFVDNTITLENQVLVEDDAPGIGSVREDAWEVLEPGIILRKYLIVEHWPLKGATLAMMVYPVLSVPAVEGGKLEFTINGNSTLVQEVQHSWISLNIPLEYLKRGENIIEVTAHGDNTEFRTPIALYSNYKYGSTARSVPSNKSARSTDGGKSWINHGLGIANNVNGEYPIRLKLQTYKQKGWLHSPVIDVIGETVEGVLHRHVSVDNVEIEMALENPENIIISIRSGTTHHPLAGGWTDWHILDQTFLQEGLKERFIQLKFEASSVIGDKTPKIYGLGLRASYTLLESATYDRITVKEAVNYPVVKSSFDFQHEDPAYPALQELRKKYKLDEIVEGAKTEIEKILRLRNWASGLWDWYLPDPELNDMIAWDARAILEPDKSIEPLQNKGGYCLHYAIVFAQACQSLGIAVRMVNINYSVWGGHEIPEVWSRDYNKWIMLDTQFDAMYVDRETGVPLNVLELHRVFLDTYYPEGEKVDRDAWSVADRDKRSKDINPNSLPIRIQIGGNALSGRLGMDYVWWKVTDEALAPGYNGGYGFYNTAEVRWLPRSNWLSQPLPMPVSHGRTHWGWDGYRVWTDKQTPETPEHRHFVRRESDMYGKLFTVDFSAVISTPGNISVAMATDSPGLAYYELNHNGKRVTTRKNHFNWELNSGRNILEMRTVDIHGNKGLKSKLVLNYRPK